MRSLYQRLSDVAQVNESVETELINTKGSVRAKIAPYSHSGECFLDALTRLIYEVERNPPIDVPQVQSAILHSPDYEDNQTLQQALEEAQGIQGGHSLTATLDRAMKINKGWRSILPRRKNPQHNQKVDEFAGIVAEEVELEDLKTRGIFKLDNLVSGFTYYGAASTALLYVLDTLQVLKVSPLSPITIGTITGAFFGILYQLKRVVRYSKKELLERTEFIDEKIRQLKQTPQLTQ